MDFYYRPTSAPCRSVIMVAKAVGVELNKKILDLRAGEQKTAEFPKINPQHILPTLDDNGFSVWESRAILIYLVEKYAKTDSLYPKCPEQQALINQRLYFDMDIMFKSFADYYNPQFIYKKPADPEMYKNIERAFDFLNIFLEGQSYLVADSLTIADIAMLATISNFAIVDFDFSKYANVTRWYENAKRVTPGFSENREGCLEIKKKYMS